MFNLNQKTNEFSQQLLSYNSLKPEDREELISHLEIEISELVDNGLSEEEAFYISKQRLGNLESIEDEFSIINSGFLWQKRFFWLAAGYLLFSLIPLLVKFASIPIQTLFEIEAFIFPSPLLFTYDFYLPYPLYILIPAGMFVLLRFNLKKAYGKNKFLNYANSEIKWFAIAAASFIVIQILHYVLSAGYIHYLYSEQLNYVQQGEDVYLFIWIVTLLIATIWATVQQRRQENRRQLSFGG